MISAHGVFRMFRKRITSNNPASTAICGNIDTPRMVNTISAERIRGRVIFQNTLTGCTPSMRAAS